MPKHYTIKPQVTPLPGKAGKGLRLKRGDVRRRRAQHPGPHPNSPRTTPSSAPRTRTTTATTPIRTVLPHPSPCSRKTPGIREGISGASTGNQTGRQIAMGPERMIVPGPSTLTRGIGNRPRCPYLFAVPTKSGCSFQARNSSTVRSSKLRIACSAEACRASHVPASSLSYMASVR